MNEMQRLLFNKLPMFNPAWPREHCQNWLDAFEFMLNCSHRLQRAETKVASRIEEIDALIVRVPQQLKDDVRQEVCYRLLQDGEQSLQPLIRQVTAQVYRDHDLKYRTVSLDAPRGESGETYADNLPG